MLNGSWNDFIDLWLEYTSASQSPAQFRLWTGISMVASALERRVWVRTGRLVTFPHSYIMLVGSPGIGKQVISDARDLFLKVRKPGSNSSAFHIASHSVTRASLMDELSKANQVFLPLSGPPISFHSLVLFSEEFRVLMPTFDNDFISRLDEIYNARNDEYRESRRTGTVRELRIEKPILNILAGVQPAYLANTLPDYIWSTGICRRFIMIYAAEGADTSVFDEGSDVNEPELIQQISVMSGLFGQAKWSQNAASKVKLFDIDWKNRLIRGSSDQEEWPIPDHSRLTFYNRSRTMFLIKLSIIAAVANRAEITIHVEDVDRALGWLLAAESFMPDIFREMRGRSDREVMEELHRFVVSLWAKSRKPVRTNLLVDFLSSRLPSEKVDRVLALTERASMLVRTDPGSDLWIPRPRYDHRLPD